MRLGRGAALGSAHSSLSFLADIAVRAESRLTAAPRALSVRSRTGGRRGGSAPKQEHGLGVNALAPQHLPAVDPHALAWVPVLLRVLGRPPTAS